MTQTIHEKPAYASLLGRASAESEPDWLTALRSEAEAAFARTGLPTFTDEEWRFTPLGDFPNVEFARALPAAPAQEALALIPESFGGWRIVLVNGHVQFEASQLPPEGSGLRVLNLHGALQECPDLLREYLGQLLSDATMPFVATNSARFTDALVIATDKGVKIDRPLEIVSLTQPSGDESPASHPRLLVLASEESELRLIELHTGPNATRYFANPVAEILVEQGARLHHYRVQWESQQSFHFAASQALVKAHGSYHLFAVANGGNVARTDLRIRLAESGAEGLLYGLYRVEDHQVSDLHSVIDHAAPHCNSWEVVKGILEDHSRGIFNGRIIVRPGAQKTDAKQTNKNLLLSRDAVVHANPQLEIYADDVKCTHGATVGHIDEQALFYLRSRGIPADVAQGLLTYAFANDVLRHVSVTGLRTWLECTILEMAHLAIDQDLLEGE